MRDTTRTRLERTLAASTVLAGYALWFALAASLGWVLAHVSFPH